MKLKRSTFYVLLVMLLSRGITFSQIPVELFAGHERTTMDIMFFKFFKNKQDALKPNRWLFFNRNRASVDYRMTKSKFLPQFGFTEAISYNHEKAKGFAPVFVAQILSWGVFPKAGIQYALIKKNITVFSWMVCETLKNPELDYFILLRYTPKISNTLNLFTQAESLNTLPTLKTENLSFTQRVRIGLELKRYQFGVGADFNQSGNISFINLYNAGGFFRHEF